ncbi:MAG: hypothetical protein M5U01_41815 [Ardenticatenaceae bacterium]|nr:hypothetical protein [Ardenticatenaceae bacterium]
MSKENSKPEDTEQGEMRPEYDFATMKGGVKGKYYKAYRAGHTVKIHQEDGTAIVQHFTLEKALRSLVTLIPEKRREVKPKRSRKEFSG